MEVYGRTAANSSRLFLLGIIFVFGVVLTGGCSIEKQEEDLTAKAWEFITVTVAKELDSPNSLTFPYNGEKDVTPLGNKRYQVTSFADYTNKKGEKDRVYFYGTVVFKDTTWTVETIKFSP